MFAQNALLFKPPFRLLGNIYLSGGATEHAGEINLKDAMMPMVSFARLYALRHQINQTHTLERIEALSERDVILPSSRDEIIAAYDFLMQLRLRPSSPPSRPAARRKTSSTPASWATSSGSCSNRPSPRSPRCRRRSATIFRGASSGGHAIRGRRWMRNDRAGRACCEMNKLS